jgi:hypothetical protein
MADTEGYKERLTKKKEKALSECPEGFELVGWVLEDKFVGYALQSDEAFPVYRKTEL